MPKQCEACICDDLQEWKAGTSRRLINEALTRLEPTHKTVVEWWRTKGTQVVCLPRWFLEEAGRENVDKLPLPMPIDALVVFYEGQVPHLSWATQMPILYSQLTAPYLAGHAEQGWLDKLFTHSPGAPMAGLRLLLVCYSEERKIVQLQNAALMATTSRRSSPFVGLGPAAPDQTPWARPSRWSNDWGSFVFRVVCTENLPDPDKPWTGGLTSRHTSTGFVLRAGQETGQSLPLLICNAHSVTQATNVTIRFNESVVDYTCRVWAVSPELDLALLCMLDEEGKEVGSRMFRDRGLELAAEPGLPAGGCKLRILGYPTNVERLSTTDGVVSRCATCRTAHGRAQVPTIQTSAAINDGNSGGPVLDPLSGRVLGVAFEGVAPAQNVGCCLPAKLVRYFVQLLVRSGRLASAPTRDWNLGETPELPALPSCGVLQVQTTENAGLRCSLGLRRDEQRGLLVCRVFPLAETTLQEGDVILKVNGRDIQRDGTYREGSYSYAWTNALLPKHIGETVAVEVERKQRLVSLRVTLVSEHKLYRCSPTYYCRKIQYFCFGGLVFSEVTAALVEANCFSPRTAELKQALAEPKKNAADVPPVTLLHVFSHELTQGYEACKYLLVTQVDDRPVTGLLQLWQLLQTKLQRPQGYVTFVLGQDKQNERRLVLDLAEVKAQGARILRENSVTSAYYLQSPVNNAG